MLVVYATGPFEAILKHRLYLLFRNMTGVIMTETVRSSYEMDATFMAKNCYEACLEACCIVAR